MLRPSAAGSVEEGHAVSEARRGSGVATKEVFQAYEPSRAHRWLVMMVSGLVVVSVVLRFPRERGVVWLLLGRPAAAVTYGGVVVVSRLPVSGLPSRVRYPSQSGRETFGTSVARAFFCRGEPVNIMFFF